MGTSQTELYVTETCTPFKKEDCISTNPEYQFMIDPCSCDHYYSCNNYKALRTQCSPGTAFNHETKGCMHTDNVILKGLCFPSEPWTRCNLTGQHLDNIIDRCTGKSSTSTTISTESVTSTALKENYTGLIVGCIIAGIFFVAFVSLFFLVWRKKITVFKSREANQSVQNPEYFNKKENIYEEYAEIDDIPDHPPDKRPSLPKRILSHENSASFGQSDTSQRKISLGYVKPIQTMKRTDFVYDNPGFTVKESRNNPSNHDHNDNMYIELADHNTPDNSITQNNSNSEFSNTNEDYYILSRE